MELKKTLKLTPTFEAVRDASMEIKAFAVEAGFSGMDAFQIELSLSEALNNIIEHGYEACNHASIAVTFLADSEQLVIQIIDHGKPNQSFGTFDKVFQNNASQLKERGFGQIIIDALMDDVCYNCKRNHNALTLTKKRLNPADPSLELTPIISTS